MRTKQFKVIRGDFAGEIFFFVCKRNASADGWVEIIEGVSGQGYRAAFFRNQITWL